VRAVKSTNLLLLVRHFKLRLPGLDRYNVTLSHFLLSVALGATAVTSTFAFPSTEPFVRMIVRKLADCSAPDTTPHCVVPLMYKDSTVSTAAREDMIEKQQATLGQIIKHIQKF